jgi:alkyl sulfatase BDS1-like metallo-beta-lactamase superfamily hydrolase
MAGKRLREVTDKPVAALIYTHHHADHINGATAFITREDAASGRVKVIAAENFLREAALENSVVGSIMGLRAMYMYGVLLPPDAEGDTLPYRLLRLQCPGGSTGYIAPNTFVPLDRETEMTLAGIRFVFFHTGGEAASHIGHLPAGPQGPVLGRRGPGADLPAAPLAARHPPARHRALGHARSTACAAWTSSTWSPAMA